jgi:hypothetical protein
MRGHEGIVDNETADQLAKTGCEHPFLGPEPACGTSIGVGKKVVRSWMNRNYKTHKTKKLHGLSPQANYTDRLSDRRLSAKLVPTLADRGCRVVSAMVPPQSLISVF